MHNLANTLGDQGKHSEAEGMHEKVRAAARRRAAQGIRAARMTPRRRPQVLEARRRVLGAEHPDTMRTMHNLANTLAAQSKHSEAEVMKREVRAAARRLAALRAAGVTPHCWPAGRAHAGSGSAAPRAWRRALRHAELDAQLGEHAG